VQVNQNQSDLSNNKMMELIDLQDPEEIKGTQKSLMHNKVPISRQSQPSC
jgi:hypothetical protein